MAEATNRNLSVSLSTIFSAWHDPAARILNVDLLTVMIAICLPWSTSGVAIFVVLWLAALIPTLELRPFLLSLKRPVSAIPVAFFALAVAGMLWSDAAWSARLYAVGPTAKLLALPLLFYHFERSDRGIWVFVAFLASCTLLMATSWAVAFEPDLTLKPEAAGRGIFVKNYIDQSQEFALCAVALAYPIMECIRTNKIWLAVLLAFAALGFVTNMIFVVSSRTALVTLPIMLAIFAFSYLRCRTVILACCAAAVVAAATWTASPRLRTTVSTFISDYQHTKLQNNPTGLGSRLEYWQKSLEFFRDAPVIGHGSGTIQGLFERAAIGETGAQAEVVKNPHNQTLNVAVQWGTVGILVLYAMWLVHLLLFRGDGLVSWIGLLTVIQNVFTSLFNSHLFDFVEGWIYVLGVGIAGGMTLGGRGSHGAAAWTNSCLRDVGRLIATRNGRWFRPAASTVLVMIAVIAAAVFGLLFYWKHVRAPQPDTALAQEIRAAGTALEKYRAAQGAYPVFEGPLVDVKKRLAGHGYFTPEAGGFPTVDSEAVYYSYNGKSYGLLFHIDRNSDNPSGTECVVQVGRSFMRGFLVGPVCPH
ncbi:O-antigen ligase family protein [Bradyrhizobium sp.]|jgi:O-antigen ligase|uniref:O-antigen ligase family protein n=1 Tax=Bradyrhizobium sp. TaxID=376 RepID=UPI002E012989|nr:O-antigen ligase family protein [Bradyrhizobium sp.]